MDDTICAISTAMGIGGISIIRVSGPESLIIVNNIFTGKNLLKVDSNTINYGHIKYNNKIIDEVLVSVMKAPKTYTREDIVEINLHGGIATTNKVLEILLESGCRLAEPGEFTKRAFLNGRIDLVEAESTMDIINAETEQARDLSVSNLTGKLSELIKIIKKQILELEANIEVNIDYPEYEDIEDMTSIKLIKAIEVIIEEFNKLIDESNNAKIIKNGLNVAIIGAPNVGKSSILNGLLEENRAIVTNIEGTTRDIIEGKIILNGVMINFIDTAGIRKTEDTVEKIGVDRSIEQIEKCDLVIYVMDGSKKTTKEEQNILDKIKSKEHIVFVNKSDLFEDNVKYDDNYVIGNTVESNGLQDLKNAIIKYIDRRNIKSKDFTYLSNARQLSLITKAKNSMESALLSVKNGMPSDIIEVDLNEAKEYLKEILGETYKDDLLDELFSSFCIGK